MSIYDFFRRHKNGRDGSTFQHFSSDSARRRQGNPDTGSLRMLEEKLAGKQDGAWLSGTRNAQESFSQAVIAAAKECALFIPKAECQHLGVRKMIPSGESTIYENKTQGIVYKVRNPFAKLHLKSPNLNHILYEHIIHNLLFPDTPYNIIGISEENQELRIVLSQPFVFETNIPTQKAIEEHLSHLDLLPEKYYYYGNPLVAVTDVDVASDNVILSSQGTLLFIDPIIKIRGSVTDILHHYSNYI